MACRRPSPALTCITMVQVLCSISIIVITSNRITHPGLGTQKRCYLSSDPSNMAPCSLAYAAAGISIAIAVLAGCLRCCSLNCCGLGPVQSIILAAVNSLWWLVVAAILTAAAVAADAAGMPAADARHIILTAAWVAVGSELLHSIMACLVVGNNVCNTLLCVEVPDGVECCDGCCCQCCHRHRRRPAVHQPLLPAAAAAAATAAVLDASLWRRRPVPVVTNVPQGGYGHSSAGYMPPPPTSGQPYIVPSAPAAWAPGHAGAPGLTTPGPSGGVHNSSSFGGFPPAAGAGSGPGTPALGFRPDSQGVLQPSAPVAPQQAYAPPVVMQQMDAGGDNKYPVVPKQ